MSRPPFRRLPASYPRTCPRRLPTAEQNPADYPVLNIALTSGTLKLSAVDEYAETIIAPTVSTVNGVALVQIYGQFKYAPHIQLDPQALSVRQIGIDDVENALANGNVNLPTGTLLGVATRANRAGHKDSFIARPIIPN